MAGLSGIQNFTMTVVATDYNRFAIVFYNMIVQDKLQMVATLLGGLSFHSHGHLGLSLKCKREPKFPPTQSLL